MPLVSLSSVSMGYDATPLFSNVTLEVEAGRKIGVVGRNGCGKTTLLRLMDGQLAPTDGEVFRQRGVRIERQAQELEVAPGATVLDEMRRVFRDELDREERLRQIEARLGEAEGAEQERLLGEYGRLQDEHETSGAWSVERRVESVLVGLGLAREDWEKPVESFSGGERRLISLARLLLAAPDVLLLDEPTNHLDMDGLDWFIRFVRDTSTAVVMVSHDRHLLDCAVDEVWEVAHGRVRRWPGNYGDYERQKAEERDLQVRQFKQQQRMIRRLEFQARRLRDMASAYDDPGQAKRAKSILKRIEQMDVVEAPETEQRAFKARFSGSRHGNIALTVKDFSFAYGDRVLFDGASFEIAFGQRVCLVGPNGSGKTTLFREVLRHGSWENPDIRLGKAVKLGDFHQFHDAILATDQKLLEWLQGETGLTAGAASDLLHRFLFTRDDLDRKIASLSGGEKSRLQLARLVHAEVNFLMLDEPTNHLDVQSCEQLEDMLEEFPGTLFMISHDRYFLDRFADVVLEIRDRGLRTFNGGFEEWWERRRRRQATLGAAPALPSERPKVEAPKGPSEAKVRREEQKARQREERQLERRIAKLEERIAGLEAREAELAAELEAAYSEGGDGARGPELARALDGVRKELAEAMEEWERAAS